MTNPCAGLLSQLATERRAHLAELAALEDGLVEVDAASEDDLDEALGFPPAPGPDTEGDVGSRPAERLPRSLEALFDRHRPVGPVQLFTAWQGRAAELGLAPGEVGDVHAAGFTAGCTRPDGPYRRAEVAIIFDALEGTMRKRRGRYRMVADPGRPPAIVADAGGAVDNLATVLRDFTALAADYRESAVVAAVEARHASDGASYTQLAGCFAISLRTLMRWRRTHGPAEHFRKVTGSEEGRGTGGSPLDRPAPPPAERPLRRSAWSRRDRVAAHGRSTGLHRS